MAANLPQTENPYPAIYIPQEWSDAADSIAYNSNTSPPPPITLICGAKNCGKTTFSRHLVNVLLQRFDNSMHEDAGKMLFFGDVSSKRDPTAYLKYISTLYDYYRQESESLGRTELPVVVNTPGWVKGIGYDILLDMLQYITPTHVIKINISFEKKNLPAGAFWLDDFHGGDVNLIEINSAHYDSFNRSQCFPSDQNITTIKELAQALAAHPPYQVPISSIKIKHLYCQVPCTEIFYSLNATIVGLAIRSEALKTYHGVQALGLLEELTH